ncbi:MAG: acyl-CoA dehydratase activase-related protein, partial [Thermodesulfobacteriota bacterium]|nr:acyl-CoA dehydratase activase-related protein [Thermodesulfobacteriota bacterium]
RIPDHRLIRPNLYLRERVESIADAVRRSLPAGFQPRRLPVEKAVEAAWAAAEAFRSELQERGRTVLSELPESEPLWVVTGRPYNLYDERLNLQLGRHLAKLGIQALPMDYLDVDGEDLSDFPRMYWGLGARILRVAKRIARTPNWYGVHLTNFSCGADSFIEHFYRHVMGEKPYLILELDEHSAVAGLLTRIEAYRNVVKTVHAKRFGGGVEPPEPAQAFSCLR